jgi:hypothetical protein
MLDDERKTKKVQIRKQFPDKEKKNYQMVDRTVEQLVVLLEKKKVVRKAVY